MRLDKKRLNLLNGFWPRRCFSIFKSQFYLCCLGFHLKAESFELKSSCNEP